MMGENNIGPIFVELQPVTDPSLARNRFRWARVTINSALAFRSRPAIRSTRCFAARGSMSWAGIYNTEFWIDPVQHIGGVMMMQVLPFYDDGAIRTLRDFEKLVYQNLR